MLNHLRSQFTTLPGSVFGPFTVATADEFTYLDPVDRTVSYNQGIRILFSDGSRIVFRLSGTAGSGATIRLYLEKYEGNVGRVDLHTAAALESLVQVALEVSDIVKLTGFESPSVIT